MLAGTDASGARPEESGQNGAGLRARVRRVLPAQPRVHAVVLQQPPVPGGVQHVLARVAHRGLLPVLQQLVHQPDRAVPGQRHVPQALRPAAVLVVREAAGRGGRVQERVHAPEERHAREGPHHHQRVDDHSQHADEHVHQTDRGDQHDHNHGSGVRVARRQHHHIEVTIIKSTGLLLT